jgi:hypothetical protein
MSSRTRYSRRAMSPLTGVERALGVLAVVPDLLERLALAVDVGGNVVQRDARAADGGRRAVLLFTRVSCRLSERRPEVQRAFAECGELGAMPWWLPS